MNAHVCDVCRFDRFWYCAGAIGLAILGVELAHRYWVPLLDVGFRAAEKWTA